MHMQVVKWYTYLQVFQLKILYYYIEDGILYFFSLNLD